MAGWFDEGRATDASRHGADPVPSTPDEAGDAMAHVPSLLRADLDATTPPDGSEGPRGLGEILTCS